jgi:TPR repeat protein
MKIFILLLSLSLSVFAQKEESEALRALRLSCQQKIGLGCYNYANMLLKRNQQEDADKYFEMGCKLEHSDSCIKKSWSEISTTKIENNLDPVAETQVTAEESTSLEASSHAPASIDEAVDISPEDQDMGEAASGENPSPEETELDLSSIE